MEAQWPEVPPRIRITVNGNELGVHGTTGLQTYEIGAVTRFDNTGDSIWFGSQTNIFGLPKYFVIRIEIPGAPQGTSTPPYNDYWYKMEDVVSIEWLPPAWPGRLEK